MGLKQTGFGIGRIVTLGGHVEPGESPAQAAVREVFEESGVTVAEADLEPPAPSSSFSRPGPSGTCPPWSTGRGPGPGSRRRQSEIVPAWYPVDGVPYPQMWPDSAHWMPEVLAGRTFPPSSRWPRTTKASPASTFPDVVHWFPLCGWCAGWGHSSPAG